MLGRRFTLAIFVLFTLTWRAWGGSWWRTLRDPEHDFEKLTSLAVQQDLQLSANVEARLRGEWQAVLTRQGRLSAMRDDDPKHGQELTSYQLDFDLFEDTARSLLSPSQLDRLYQLTFQDSGLYYMDRPVTAGKLGLTDNQKKSFHDQFRAAVARRNKADVENKLPPNASTEEIKAMTDRSQAITVVYMAELRAIPAKILSAKQMAIYANLGGRPLEQTVEPVETNPPR